MMLNILGLDGNMWGMNGDREKKRPAREAASRIGWEDIMKETGEEPGHSGILETQWRKKLNKTRVSTVSQAAGSLSLQAWELRSWRWDVPGYSAEVENRACGEGLKGNQETEEVETINSFRRYKGQ